MIQLSESPEKLRYFCRWTIRPQEAGVITALQEVEVEGVPEKMENGFTFYDITSDSCGVRLQNQLLGEVEGTGVIDDKVLAWEFRNQGEQGFEGFEVYEKRDEGTFSMRAEYASVDQLRTTILGKLWEKEEG